MIDSQQIEDEIRNILVTTMEVDVAGFAPAALLSDLGMDSLAFMELSVQLEDNLDVQIDAAELASLTVTELMTRVEKLRGQG